MVRYMKYKILFSVLAILFVFLLASGTAFAAPVEIRTTDDLMKIDDSAANLSLDYILMNDLNFAGKTFTPIGTESSPFKGTFNGNNKTISNITFSNSAMNYVGLFGYARDAKFSNVVLKNINVTGNNNVGGFLGYGSGVSIEGCSIESSPIITGKNEVGGFAGSLGNSYVFNSYATEEVVGSDYTGGFVGSLWYSSLSNCYATGKVSGRLGSAGGFVGKMFESSVFNSYATGEVSGGSPGGFAGTMQAQSSISNSYATGDAKTSTSYLGGGFTSPLDYVSSNSTVSNCFYTGLPNHDASKGGLFVTPAKLKQISTFTNASWNISSSPNSNTIWYITEGNTPPLLNRNYISPVYTVTFNSNGGNPVPAKTVHSGNPVARPTSPAKIGYILVEWQLNGVAYNFSTPVTSNLTLVAVYNSITPTYTVTFNSDGGTSVSSQFVNSGNVVAKPANPTKNGYTFVEWRLNGAAYNFSAPVTSNLTLFAVYTTLVTNPYWDGSDGLSESHSSVTSAGGGSGSADNKRLSGEANSKLTNEDGSSIEANSKADHNSSSSKTTGTTSTGIVVESKSSSTGSGSTSSSSVTMNGDSGQSSSTAGNLFTINVRYYENGVLLPALNTTVSVWAGYSINEANVTIPAGYKLVSFAPTLPATMANNSVLKVNIVKIRSDAQ